MGGRGRSRESGALPTDVVGLETIPTSDSGAERDDDRVKLGTRTWDEVARRGKVRPVSSLVWVGSRLGFTGRRGKVEVIGWGEGGR